MKKYTKYFKPSKKLEIEIVIVCNFLIDLFVILYYFVEVLFSGESSLRNSVEFLYLRAL